MKRLAILALSSLMLLSCGGGTSGPGGQPFGAGFTRVSASAEIGEFETAMFRRLNQDRAQNGLPALAYDTELADIGRAHSNDMHVSKFFAHESPNTGSLEDRLDRAGYLAVVARENLGEGPDINSTQDGLLKSPGHHANIMADDITHVGIGIVSGGVLDGRNLVVTQVFATPAEPAQPDEIINAVLEKIGAARASAGLQPLKENELLSSLAEAQVENLPNDFDQSSADAIGQAIAKALADKSDHGLRGVGIATTLTLSASIYTPAPAALQANARAYGIAAKPAKDERGRPAVKVLLLIGN